MIVVLTFLILGLALGLRIQSRLGALFLCLAGVAVVHVVLEAGPRLLGQSAYGRRIGVALHAFAEHGGGSLTDTTLAVVAGVLAAAILQTLSEDRRVTKWDPDTGATARKIKRERRARRDLNVT
jgi:hypothetical protein